MAGGQGWFCREEESPDRLNEELGSSEYAWGYYVKGVAAGFAASMGMPCSDWDDVPRVLDRTTVISAPDAAALVRLLVQNPA